MTARRFFVASNERESSSEDVYRYSTANYERELVFTNRDKYSPMTVSPDGRWLALLKVHSNANNDIYLVDLNRPNKVKSITKHKGDVSHTGFAFDPIDMSFYYGSNKDSEFVQVWRYDLSSKRSRVELGNQVGCDATFCFRDQGRYRAITQNVEAASVVTIHDRVDDRSIALPVAAGHNVTGLRFSQGEAQVAYYVTSDGLAGEPARHQACLD